MSAPQTPYPDPRVLEDLCEAGRRALLRAAREDGEARERIEAAADAVLALARQLRDERGAPRG